MRFLFDKQSTAPQRLALVVYLLTAAAVRAESPLDLALAKAGDNAGELRAALERAPADQQPGVRFLIENMPQRDLESLSAEYLLENVDYAYRAWREAPWADQVDEQLFFNSVLPYASVNERRDRWRKDFYDRMKPLVADAASPGEAAAMLNNKVFDLLGVKYSTGRAKADQSPYETTESGLASCTGLSVLLIDACRAVGVPARFVGTPLWSDHSGNHSWVEVWDDGWRFTGAAEPTDMRLDDGWFVARAARAKSDDPRYAIYATSFRKTPLSFPCVWGPQIDYIPAVNVTDRYTTGAEAIPDGHAEARFKFVDAESGGRACCSVRVIDSAGETVFTGRTKDERFDANDHLSTTLPKGQTYHAVADLGGEQLAVEFRLESEEQLVTLRGDAPADPIAELRKWLKQSGIERSDLTETSWASAPLTATQAAEAQRLLWRDYSRTIRETHAEEMEARVLVDGDLKMPFFYKVFGEKPRGGRSLFISMHGGGGAPASVNDQQYKNQQRLYTPEEGVYLAPRAPTNNWNLWHEAHIDGLFDRLITNLVVLEGVDPNRVYLMGYSAGGDGVYQLAPRMADRWAAAAMMAGHPNDASPVGLRNLPFALYMGGQDGAFDRNKVAAEWETKLADLAKNEPGGYPHLVTIYPDKGHWMDGEDKSAVPWMAEHTRDPFPAKVIWRQDDVTHPRFYWLAVEKPQAETTITATRDAQQVDLQSDDVGRVTVRLNDQMIDLDKPVRITSGDRVLHDGRVERTIATLAKTLEERGDPASLFPAEIEVSVGDEN